jgi:DNA/RNA-binding domain of Phe-tRNA-synthetase-like protein
MPIIELVHEGPATLAVGVVVAEGVSAERYPDRFEEVLAEQLRTRRGELDEHDDEWRRDVRDVFRNGRFKPTGRGKPASEYLLGAARKETFPRINSIVDICNYVSLRYVIPVSVCDLDRAGSGRFVVRLGLPGEEYVFNTAGQTIGLEDLIVGCVATQNDESTPVINAVKDSMRTKTTPESTRVCALLYGPATDPRGRITEATSLFEGLIAETGGAVFTASIVLTAGQSADLTPIPADE